MSREEFIGWVAFYQLEPWGCDIEDQRAATALDLTYAVHSSKNSTPPVWFDRDPISRIKPDPTPAELDEKIRDFFMGRAVKADQPTPDEPPAK